MTILRRDFLKTLGAGAAAMHFVPAHPESPADTRHDQHLHQDFQSDNAGVAYWFLGNGLLQAALQTSSSDSAGTHCGLLVMSPEHFGRKSSTFLYHPERGLMNSRFTAIVEGSPHQPAFASTRVRRTMETGFPELRVDWTAGGCTVSESLSCPANDPALIRHIVITNTGSTTVRTGGYLLLYPNLMLFDEYAVDREGGMLTARGYLTLRLFADVPVETGDRHLTIPARELPPGATQEFRFILTLDQTREEFTRISEPDRRRETSSAWSHAGTMTTSHAGLDHLFLSSVACLRAAVARSGKMDGGIWQYNLEWVRDQAMVAVGTTMSGQTEIAEALLRRILTHAIDESGRTVDSSRHRPPEKMELDQNGELLYALAMHRKWTGKDDIIREFWPKIRNVADYVLQPVFCDQETGLLRNTREYWEREASFGLKEGYELTYQMWNFIGLQDAAAIARAMGEPEAATRWETAAARMKTSFLNHPRFSLVEDGQFIKRRLLSGDVQRTLDPPNRASMPAGMPLNVESVSYCDPDSSNVLPIALGVVDPRGELATKTLSSVELLWNQRWTGGGYGRYNVTSEPDSPGPWPFATMFIARAYLEAGNDAKVWRALEWMLRTPGGAAGSWLEFYGNRPTPPLPPVGVVVWTWGELLTFFVHHMFGIRPDVGALVVRPRLLSGLESARLAVPVRGHRVDVTVRRATGAPSATVNGRSHPVVNGSLTLPVPAAPLTIAISV